MTAGKGSDRLADGVLLGGSFLDIRQLEDEDTREYTIKIIPHQGEIVRTAHLPMKVIKYGLASIVTGAVLFVGAFSYATYGALNTHFDAVELKELREVNRSQQEQLLELSKKANSLQDEMDKLNKLEEELRQMATIEPGSVVTPPAAHDGQGGPYIRPNVWLVNNAFDTLASRMAKKRQELEQLRQAIHEHQKQVAYQNSINAAIPSIWPAEGEVSSPYGLRWEGTDFHPGIDIANDYGTPIVAAADGIVTDAGWNSGGYGNLVDIDHGNGIMTRYGHAQAVVVSAGQTVKKGQIIAYMGSTGFSTGPHVHYEIHVNGQVINPAGYL